MENPRNKRFIGLTFLAIRRSAKTSVTVLLPGAAVPSSGVCAPCGLPGCPSLGGRLVCHIHCRGIAMSVSGKLILLNDAVSA